VVNYLRALQGVGSKSVAVGPLAAPGVTGDKVPGATRSAPQLSEPFYNPRSVLPGGQQAAPAITPAEPVNPAAIRPDTSARARTDSASAGTRPDR